RLEVQVPGRLDDGRGDRVVSAPGAQGGHGPLVVPAREADAVGGQTGVPDLGFGDVAHEASTASTTSRADSGIPPYERTDVMWSSGVFVSRASRARSWPSRFCSTTKTRSCARRKSTTSG